MIFGRPGSGKSTFSLALHKLTGLSLHHLDKYFFISNWIERDYEEFIHIQENMVNQDAWIVDGNNAKSLELRYAKADLVLYFNYPRYLCYWRILKRLFCKRQEIEDRAEGCRETIRLKFLQYVWTFEKQVEEKIQYLKERYPQVVFKEIKSDKALDWVWDNIAKKG